MMVAAVVLVQADHISHAGTERGTHDVTTAKKLVLTVPPGASSGLITFTGWSGDVTSSKTFKVT